MPFWLSRERKSVTPKGADPDTLVASANAQYSAPQQAQSSGSAASQTPCGAVRGTRELYIDVAGPWPAIRFGAYLLRGDLVAVFGCTAKVEENPLLVHRGREFVPDRSTCRLTTARNFVVSVAIRDVWLTMRRRIRADLQPLRGRRRRTDGFEKTNSLMPLSVRSLVTNLFSGGDSPSRDLRRQPSRGIHIRRAPARSAGRKIVIGRRDWRRAALLAFRDDAEQRDRKDLKNVHGCEHFSRRRSGVERASAGASP